MPDEWIHDHDPAWASQFQEIAGRLRRALGPMADRIDHIGSTAVPGLAAKPVIDIQVSVAQLEPGDAFVPLITSCGYLWRTDNPDLTKRYFRELPGAPRTHIHVRRTGSFSEQAALLFRDFLREHPERADIYAAEKRRHAHLLGIDRAAYVAGKAPIIWQLLREADEWSQAVGWSPGTPDA